MRRNVCGWCGVSLRAGALRPDRRAVVCRDCGTSMLVTAEADVATLPPTCRALGGARSLRVAPSWRSGVGGLRRWSSFAGTAIVTVLLVFWIAAEVWDRPRSPWLGLIYGAVFASVWLSQILGIFGGPYRSVRFNRRGARRGRERAPSLVRAVLVESAGFGGTWSADYRFHRVAYVDERWHRRTVARFPWVQESAARALGLAIRDVVGSGGDGERSFEVRAPRTSVSL